MFSDQPKSYALNCELKLEKAAIDAGDTTPLNDFFVNSIDDYKFELKCIKRKSVNKYNDTGIYEVELYDEATKMSLYSLYLSKRVSGEDVSTDTDNTGVSSLIETTAKELTLNDKAIADEVNLNNTYARNNATEDGCDDFTFSDTMLPHKTGQVSVCEQSWSHTPTHLKNKNVPTPSVLANQKPAASNLTNVSSQAYFNLVKIANEKKYRKIPHIIPDINRHEHFLCSFCANLFYSTKLKHFY